MPGICQNQNDGVRILQTVVYQRRRESLRRVANEFIDNDDVRRRTVRSVFITGNDFAETSGMPIYEFPVLRFDVIGKPSVARKMPTAAQRSSSACCLSLAAA